MITMQRLKGCLNKMADLLKYNEKDLLLGEPEVVGGKKKKINSTKEEVLENSLDSVGYGLFHVIIVLVCGLGLASDSVEVLCVSFAIPVAEGELQLSSIDKAVLDSMIFVGMMIGGLFWGSLADAVGRRTCLITSLLVNGLSGLLSAFMPNFGWFLFFRLMSGIGVGGSLPVVFSYFSEFFSAKKKGPLVIVLASFWMVGQVYTALIAWGLLSDPCLVNLHLGSMPFRSWRVFAILCTLPALTAAVAFIFLPESPSWLYRSGRVHKAEKALQTIARINSLCCKRNVFKENERSSFLLQEQDDDCDLPGNRVPSSPLASTADSGDEDGLGGSRGGGSNSKCGVWLRSKLIGPGRKALKAIYTLFTRAYLRTTIVMLIVQVCLSFGYYGLQIWFPEYFEMLQHNLQNTTSGGCALLGDSCTYSSYNSSSNSSNSSSSSSSSCSQVYFDSLLETAATVPGTILGILTINLIGGRIQITFSMVLAGLSVFLIWWLPPSESTVVGLSCMFSGFTIIGWNSLDVLQVEYFDTEVRSSAMGLLNSAARIAIIASNFTFGAFQNSDPSMPILLAAITLFIGGGFPLLLPLSDDPLKQSLLGKYIRKWTKPVRSKMKRTCVTDCCDGRRTIDHCD